MRSIPRLFIDTPLSLETEIAPDEGQSKYLSRVMRLGVGDEVRVFNGRDGEWLCRLTDVAGKRVTLVAEERRRAQGAVTPDLHLLFAPLKKARTDFVVEKATELGVSAIRPVLTERTQSERLRIDRLKSIALEAAEQTERMDVPDILEPIKLAKLLSGWDASRTLIFCDEAGDDAGDIWGGDRGRGQPLRAALEAKRCEKVGVLIGPEGGFSPAERDALRALPFVLAVTLGPRILRAETAALAALTVWQSVCGDWR